MKKPAEKLFKLYQLKINIYMSSNGYWLKLITVIIKDYSTQYQNPTCKSNDVSISFNDTMFKYGNQIVPLLTIFFCMCARWEIVIKTEIVSPGPN